MGLKEAFQDNPPEMFAHAGVYDMQQLGMGLVGVMVSAPGLNFFECEYTVFQCAKITGSYREKVGAIAHLAILPETDNGFIKMKVRNKRSRPLEAPTLEPGGISLTWNLTETVQDMFSRIEPAAEADLGEFFYSPTEEDEDPPVSEWIAFLDSALMDRTIATARSPARRRVSFMTGLRDEHNPHQSLSEQLQSVELRDNGKIKNPDPLLMALAYSIGRIEWLAQQGRLPIQLMLGANASV